MYQRLCKSIGNSKSTFFSSRHLHSKQLNVRVSSIDHDGCFGLQYMDPCQVGLLHAPLVELLKKQKEVYATDYVMSFSNRQSVRLDCFNAITNRNNLAFPVAKAFAKAIDAYFDPLLLADITGKRKPGFTVSRMRDAASEKMLNLENQIPEDVLYQLMNEEGFNFVFSGDKINIIYAQIHRITLLHPQSTIHFHFYDDLMGEVLNPAIKFYKENKVLIPKNVSLHFHYYSTLDVKIELPMLMSSIHGEGVVDEDYYRTVTLMGHIAHKVEGTEKFKYTMSHYISAERIESSVLKDRIKP